MALSDYNTSKDLNVTIDGVQIDMGRDAWETAHAIRAIMADIKTDLDGTWTVNALNLGGTNLTVYQQGTFTPVVADAATGGNTGTATVSGVYTQIGNIITFELYIVNVDTTGMTGTNDVYIRGFPAAFRSGAFFQAPFPTHVNSTAVTTRYPVSLHPEQGQTYARLREHATNNYTNVNQLTSGAADIFARGTYLA